jgi:hypothetical protein
MLNRCTNSELTTQRAYASYCATRATITFSIAPTIQLIVVHPTKKGGLDVFPAEHFWIQKGPGRTDGGALHH